MYIALTFDYELFFGNDTGSIEQCLIYPTQQLIQIFKEHSIKATFFIDAFYLLNLKKDAEHNFYSKQEWKVVANNLIELKKHQHELGLHIHPHWINSFRKDNKWLMDTSKYRFHQHNKNIREEFFYHSYCLLKEFEPELKSFRAGGWCIQPFKDFSELFLHYNITIDSSVVPFMKMHTIHHQFDFSNTSTDKDYWYFSEDPLQISNNGQFVEIPITPDYVYPIHQYQMFVLHRIYPNYHLPFGDGSWLKDNVHHFKKYLLPYHHFASTDGLFAGRLKKIFHRLKKNKKQIMVTLGHPKSTSIYSLNQIKKFISTSDGCKFDTLQNIQKQLQTQR